MEAQINKIMSETEPRSEKPLLSALAVFAVVFVMNIAFWHALKDVLPMSTEFGVAYSAAISGVFGAPTYLMRHHKAAARTAHTPTDN